tara:strand:- start:352 stop:774 length:423 start_codon:yes stop_codon:yes gene_type:complete
MKLSIFKKVIREVVREEIEYSIKGLRKELKEVLVSSINKNMLEEKTSVTTSKPIQNENIPTARKPIEERVPMTKNSILNDILNETANDGEWKNINKEAEVQSVIDDTAGLPDHLAGALTKDYSQVMKAVDKKANFNKSPR